MTDEDERRPDKPDDTKPDAASRRAKLGKAELPDMTRERARSERRDVDLERGEPLAGGRGAAVPVPCERHRVRSPNTRAGRGSS